MALAEIPSAQSRIEYEMSLPDAVRVTVAEGQPLRLATPITGTLTVKAKLSGDTAASPVLYPGSQVLSGKVSTSADYCTRSVVADGATKAVLVYDAIIPSGASVTPQLRVDTGAWQALSANGTTPQGDGLVEYRFQQPLKSANLMKVRLTLVGTSQSRPIVRNIRLMAVK